jgi:hypothetical protein
VAADPATGQKEDDMRNLLFRFAGVTVVLACLVYPAFTQVPAKPDLKEGFRIHDKNGDGMIDRAEFQEWMVDAFFAKDKDHKGHLVFEDIRDVMSVEIFKADDKDSDGKLTLHEFLNAVFLDYYAADVNKNGALTMEEIDVYTTKRAAK